MCIFNYNKKEWNLVVLTIVSSLDYEEGILSYICVEMAYQLKYGLYVFFSFDNVIKFSTHNLLTQS